MFASRLRPAYNSSPPPPSPSLSSLSTSSSSSSSRPLLAFPFPPRRRTRPSVRHMLSFAKLSLLVPLFLALAGASVWLATLDTGWANPYGAARNLWEPPTAPGACEAGPSHFSPPYASPAQGFAAQGENHTHPLYGLLRDAKDQWERVHSSQSKTLAAAEKEYFRRYGLPPPPGFAKWFAWTQNHSVHFVDEYDSLGETMAVLRGAGGTHLAERRDAFVEQGDARSHLVEISNGVCREGIPKDMGSICALVEGVLGDLGDIPKLVYSSHDEGFMSISYEERERLKRFGREGKSAGPTSSYQPLPFPKVNPANVASGVSTTYHHITHALCSPSSASHTLRSSSSSSAATWDSAAADARYSLPLSLGGFVTNYSLQSDICEGLGWRESNGIALQFTDMMWRNDFFAPNALVPLFSQSRFSAQSDIQIPTIYPGGLAGPPASIPWKERKAKVVWRGQATGVLYPGNEIIGGDWRSSLRFKLHRMCTNRWGFSDVAWPEDKDSDVLVAEEDSGRDVRLRVSRTANAEIVDRFLDCGLTGATFCGDEDCKSVKKEVDFIPEFRDYEQFKYVLDVDGYGWSARFRNLLLRGSPVLKTTAFPEFHSPYLIPFYHFIPVRYDLQDVPSLMAFFAGATDDGGAGSARDEMAEEIGRRGKEFAERYWRDEDRTAYVWRVLLEYRRAMSLP